jgi:hypothetical protein
LTTLTLVNITVTEASHLAPLVQCPALTSLDLIQHNKVAALLSGDACLEQLSHMTQLTRLVLKGRISGLGNPGLLSLKQLSRLTHLAISWVPGQTPVTQVSGEGTCISGSQGLTIVQEDVPCCKRANAASNWYLCRLMRHASCCQGTQDDSSNSGSDPCISLLCQLLNIPSCADPILTTWLSHCLPPSPYAGRRNAAAGHPAPPAAPFPRRSRAADLQQQQPFNHLRPCQSSSSSCRPSGFSSTGSSGSSAV